MILIHYCNSFASTHISLPTSPNPKFNSSEFLIHFDAFLYPLNFSRFFFSNTIYQEDICHLCIVISPTLPPFMLTEFHSQRTVLNFVNMLADKVAACSQNPQALGTSTTLGYIG